MIREDRELLAELARMNSDVVPLAMRIMDGSITSDKQYAFAQRLIATATQLHVRGSTPWRVVEGAVVTASDNDDGTMQRWER